MKAKVFITLKNGVHDPQGEAVRGSLHHLGFTSVENVRIGKYIELNLPSASKESAQQQVKAMCEKLLSNPVIESYSFELE